MHIQSIANYGDLFFPPNLFFNNKVVSFYSFDNKTPGVPPVEHELWCKTSASESTAFQTDFLMTTDTLMTSPGHVILGKIYTALHCTTSRNINGGWCSNDGGQHRYYYFTNGSNQPVKLPAGWTGKILFFGQNGTAYNIFSMPIDYAHALWSPDDDCHSSSIKIDGDTSGYLQITPSPPSKGHDTQASGKFYNPDARPGLQRLNKVVVQLPGAQSSNARNIWSAGASPTLAKGIKMYLDKSKISTASPPIAAQGPGTAKYLAVNVMGYYDYPNPIPVDFSFLDHDTDHHDGGCNNAYWKGLGVIVITTNDKVPTTY